MPYLPIAVAHGASYQRKDKRYRPPERIAIAPQPNAIAQEKEVNHYKQTKQTQQWPRFQAPPSVNSKSKNQAAWQIDRIDCPPNFDVKDIEKGKKHTSGQEKIEKAQVYFSVEFDLMIHLLKFEN